MPLLTRLVPVAAFSLVVSSGTHAQAPIGADARARELLSRTAEGQEAKVPCAELDAAIVRALIDAGDHVSFTTSPQVTVAYRLAERGARCVQSDPLIGAALNGLANSLQWRGDNAGAVRTAEESVAIHERLHDLVGLATAWNTIGNAHWWVQEMPDALAAFAKSLEASTAAGDRSLQARVFNNIGNVHRFLGDYTTAFEDFSRALAVFNELGDQRRAAVVTDNLGILQSLRGDFAISLEFAERALAVRRQLGDQLGIGKSLDSIGNAYLSLGNYGAALNAFEEALRIRLSADDRAGAMETTHNLGLAHFAQGDDELAIDAYKRAIALNRLWHLQDADIVGEALRNIGAAAWRLGQRERAAADFRESLTIAKKGGAPRREAILFHDLGRVALAEGKLAEAEGLFHQALAINEKIGDQGGVTDALTSLASTHVAARRYEQALDTAHRAVANAMTHDQPEELWRAQTAMGAALRHLNRPVEAKQSLDDAIRSVEALSATTIGGENLRQQFFEDKLAPYHESIAQAIGERAFGEALELAERSKTRVLTQLLRSNRSDRSTSLTADDIRERDKRRDAIASYTRQIETTLEEQGSDLARLTQLETARRTAREDLASFETTLAARHPETATSERAAAPSKIADAGSVLTATDQAVVEYVVTDRQVFGLVVTTDGTRTTVVGRALDVTPAQLSAQVTRFRDQIRARDFAVTDSARSLYAWLLAPFARELAHHAQVIVVPDGVLWTVPFQALLGPDGYVIEAHSVSYAPSLTALREIRQLPKLTGPRTVLALGKATFGSTLGLEPLPAAEAQVRSIRDLYGPTRSAIYVGDQATESRFAAEAPHYSVLHLATHGVLDEASPLYSHLVLTPSADGEDDGRLDAQEIMHLKLNADLVVLAACDTGRGRIAPGEGVIGMMWALFAAGARSMVVSQFPVESASTTDLLIGFHRHLASGTGAKAAQLRAAALELLHTPRSAHPYYWAGFILVGDPE